MSSSIKPKVSVAIPTLDGMDYLPNLMHSLETQVDVELEIIIFDSESTDGTWEFVSQLPNVKSHTVKRSEFSHGGTRQLMAETATCDVVLYLTQDATPVGELWAFTHYYLHTFYGLNVGAVLGAQRPRPNAHAAIAQRIIRTFDELGANTGITLFSNNEVIRRLYGSQPLAFLSDVNASYKRSLLIGEVPFRNVPYAEDQFMARDLLSNNYEILFAPLADVFHSNDIPLRKYSKRIFDEVTGVAGAVNVPPSAFSTLGALKSFSLNLWHDWKYLFRHRRSLGKRRVFIEFLVAPLFEIAGVRGHNKAASNF
jgi:rhamnosyltransferase